MTCAMGGHPCVWDDIQKYMCVLNEVCRYVCLLLTNKNSVNEFEDLIGFIEQFVNWAASHLQVERNPEKLQYGRFV